MNNKSSPQKENATKVNLILHAHGYALLEKVLYECID
jgi:hypothetical protein